MPDAEKHLEALLNDDDWVENFESKLHENEQGCLIWHGSVDRAGYGRIHVKKHCERPTGRNFFAHRVAYSIQTGEILEPQELILHQCHTRLCCNSDCFEIGDHYDNMDDLHESGRIAGERNPKSKLSEDEVWLILELYYDDGYTVTQLIDKLPNVKRGTITDIIYGRTWRDIYEEFRETE